MLDDALDWELVSMCEPAIESGEQVRQGPIPVRNVNRAVGGILSGEIARRRGPRGLAEGTIEIAFAGSAGQSFAAWLAPGVTFSLHGETNDYTGKGLSGGIVAVRPPRRRCSAPRRTCSSATPSCTERPPAVRSSAVWRASGSRSATRVRWPSSRASATTAAST